MPRPRPEGQLDRILDAAERVFVRVGLVRGRMATIAREAGVSEASLYYYFRSKEALFAWTLRRASEPGLDFPTDVPIAEPAGFDVASFARSAPRAYLGHPLLTRALQTGPTEDLESELRDVITELYDETAANCRVVDLIESMAIGNPATHETWFSDVVTALNASWARYFEQRAAVLRLETSPLDAAIFVIVNCHVFARVRHRMPTLRIADDATRETVVETLVRSLVRR